MSNLQVLHSPPRLGVGSRLIADRVYYLPTYLHDKNNPDGTSWLFMRRIIIWRQRSGRVERRSISDVRSYPDGDAMVADIEAHPDWTEASAEADGNPQWMPEDLAALTEGEM